MLCARFYLFPFSNWQIELIIFWLIRIRINVTWVCLFWDWIRFSFIYESWMCLLLYILLRLLLFPWVNNELTAIDSLRLVWAKRSTWFSVHGFNHLEWETWSRRDRVIVVNNNRLKCLRFDHSFCFSKLVFLNSILPFNINFGVIGLIFKECHIYGGVEPFCDGKVTFIALMVWRVS